MLNFNKKTGLSVLAALMLVMSVFSGVGMAAIDNETTTTTSTSDIVQGTAVSINSTSSGSYTLQADSLTADGQFEIRDANGNVLIVADNLTVVDSASGTYSASISDSDLRQNVNLDDGTAANLTLVAIDDTTLDDANQTESSVTFDVTADDFSSRSVDANSTGVDLGDEPTEVLGLSFGEQDAEVDINGVAVDGNTSEVVIDTSDAELTDALALEGLDSENPVIEQSASVGGEHVPLYYGAAPADEDGAHVVADGDDYVFVPASGANYTSGDTVDITISSEGFGVLDAGDVVDLYESADYGYTGFFSDYTSSMIPGFVGGFSLIGGAFVLVRRRNVA
ncbi:hypothetical protein N0B31_10200 [Salinirubellus salinus]|uniref:Uncharacterized protein n=1 Tax=Salinirubellus salinus TaxID=1364945 RepID=A0A9E7R666_9EURY|nr:hypothetical protein [Salinirubellus salinus]UWM56646.1 hypothetical protein N0B31_10200 [Salinirubellus salinus]